MILNFLSICRSTTYTNSLVWLLAHHVPVFDVSFYKLPWWNTISFTLLKCIQKKKYATIDMKLVKFTTSIVNYMYVVWILFWDSYALIFHLSYYIGILFDWYSNCFDMLVSWYLPNIFTNLQTLCDLYMLCSLTFDDDIAIYVHQFNGASISKNSFL